MDAALCIMKIKHFCVEKGAVFGSNPCETRGFAAAGELKTNVFKKPVDNAP